MEIEVVEKNVTRVKVTIGPNRCTVKFPLTFDGNKEVYLKHVKTLIGELQPIELTWRGRFSSNGLISLSNNSQTETRRFHFNLEKKELC